jgi:DNA processing protein
MDQSPLWLRLANLQLPARACIGLLERFGGIEEIFSAPTSMLGSIPALSPAGISRLTDTGYSARAEQLEALKRLSIEILPITSSRYPPSLKRIADPPAVLFVRGGLDHRDETAVALVGSRKATSYGMGIASRFAKELSQAGVTIISGGASGIDTAAHRAALDAGGRTVVVFGTAIDVSYPAFNRPLFERVVEAGQGALISEFPPGAKSSAWYFPARNRIVSGLSQCVVVVEAGEHSGALITSSVGAEQGRDVMAVPGSIDSEASRGCNHLIRDGAGVATCTKDILDQMGMLVLEHPVQASAPALHKDAPAGQRRLMERLNLTPKHLDAVASEAQMPVSEASAQLMMLELSGLVRRLPGNLYIRAQ